MASFAARDASREFFFDWTPEDLPSEFMSDVLAYRVTSSPRWIGFWSDLDIGIERKDC